MVAEDEEGLRRWERKVLCMIHGPVNVGGHWRMLTNRVWRTGILLILSWQTGSVG